MSKVMSNYWLVVGLCAWAAVFGVWPFAEPDHDTYHLTITWLDLGLHVIGTFGVYVLSPYRLHRIRDTWQPAMEGQR